MERIEKTLEIGVPLSTAYSQWLHFDKQKGWHGEITQQVTDEVIAWRSDADAGQVRFEPVSSERTRLRVAMQYEPQSVDATQGDAQSAMSRRVERTLQDFRRFVEKPERG